MSTPSSAASAGSPPGAELWRGRGPGLRNRLRFLWSRPLAIVGILLLFLLLLAALLWILLIRVPRTPFIFVHSGEYARPFPPNAWVAEDLQRLRSLEDPLLFHEIESRSSDDIRTELKLDNAMSQMGLTAEESAKSPVVVVYISMHGIVDGGVPYLVPAGASPRDPATWLPLSDVLERIASSASDAPSSTEQHKLVVLDCHRLQSDWSLGLVQNDFSSALEAWWNANKAAYPDLSILAAAGPGQRAEVSTELQGSVFGYFLALALSREITLEELNTQLAQNISRWASQHEAAQTPMLLTAAGIPNIDLIQASGEVRAPQWRAPVVSPPERQALWRSLENLRQHPLHRFEPGAWSDLEQRMMWLEELADSGSAYEEAARTTADTLSQQFRGINDRLAAVSSDRSLRQFTGLVSGSNDSIPTDLKLHSLPLAECFGTLEPDVAGRAASHLAQFGAAPSPVQLVRALRGLERLGLRDYAERRFLWMLQRYEFLQMWQQADVLAGVLRTRALAEELARPRGAAGAPGDERAHYWVRDVLNEADQARRAAEDRLFIDGQADVESHLETAQRLYESAHQASDGLALAMRTRDRALGELGYYAQWLTNTADAANADLVNELLLPVAAQARQLEVLLADNDARDAAAAQTTIAQTLQAASNVESGLNRLRDQLEQYEPANRRSVDAVLGVPQLSADRRQKLRKRKDEPARDESSGAGGDSPAEAPPSGDGQEQQLAATPSPSAQNAPFADAWTAPLFAIFAESPGEISTNEWRESWWSAANRLAEQLEEAKNTELSRQHWASLERQLRAMTPFWYPEATGISQEVVDLPVRKLRSIDLQALLVWHAERALRDYWGPAGQSRSFFQLAATDYLEAARRLAGESPAIAALDEQVKQCVAAAHGWLATHATGDVLLETSDDAQTEIHVAIDHANEAHSGGMAAVLLRHQGQRLEGPKFDVHGGIEVTADARTVKARIPNAQVPAVPAEIDATAMFRGHEYHSQFAVEPLGGVIIDHRPYEYEPGRVILHSPWNKLAVMLLIDCSQSMEQELEPGKSRLTVAKEALQQLMSRIGSQRNVRVGVRLFGHRVGWSTERPVRVVTSPTYAGPLPPGITPDRDVERVLPLDDFGFQSAQQLFAALEGVKQGWGQSPLFYCLAQALREDFAAETPDTDQHIIVITDGRNYQFRPTAEERTGLDDVLQAWRQHPVRIHILGLDIDAAEERAATAEFVRVADQARGLYRSLDSRLDLQATLNAILAPESYQLRKSDGSIADQGELGVPLRDAAQRTSDWYVVQKDDIQESIWLEGGEEIDLYYRPGGSRFHAFAYDHDVEGTSLIRSDYSGLGGDYAYRAHRPARNDRDVQFPLSLQRFDTTAARNRRDIWQWTPRPAESWLEITPLLSGDRPADVTYHFYDANWEPQKQVPELRLVANDWPGGSNRAMIQAWFKSPATAPTHVFPLSEVVTAENGAVHAFDREVAPGVSIQIDARYVKTTICDDVASRTAMPNSSDSICYRLRVVERHHSQPANLGALKVLLPRGDRVRPDCVVRQFDQRHGLVVHSFYYCGADDALVGRLQAAEIGVATRDAVNAGAVRAPEMIVNISESGSLLPLARQSIQAE